MVSFLSVAAWAPGAPAFYFGTAESFGAILGDAFFRELQVYLFGSTHLELHSVKKSRQICDRGLYLKRQGS
jgi:hypothetical protein